MAFRVEDKGFTVNEHDQLARVRRVVCVECGATVDAKTMAAAPDAHTCPKKAAP